MLRVRPWTAKQGRSWCERVHRRLPRVQGALWCVRVDRDGETVGAALVGHPARVWMDDGVLCVLRVAVIDDAYNACSMLYGSCSRAAKAMGASDLVTYTHMDEPGTSLRASGWIDAGTTDGGEWSRDGREREPALFPESKRRWFAPWGHRAKAVCGARGGEHVGD